MCLCPFHGNTESPAFAVDKEKGLFTCFNPSCNNSGKLEDLPRRILSKNFFQSKRIILKHKNAVAKPLVERLADISKKAELPEVDSETVDRLAENFWNSPAVSYMRGRGFNDDTLKFFKIGYSFKKNLVSVPMYDPTGKFCVGFIGRTIEDKRFRNSDGLPKKEIPWNLQNARLHGDTVIVCESSFDAMRIHQAGYPNVIALLGGHLSPWHIDHLNKNFSRIIIMTDFDKQQFQVNCNKCKKQGHRLCVGHRPGRDLGRQIVTQLPNKRVFWAAYDDTCVYPRGVKDATDMTDEEIRHCLKNAISNFTYSQWNIENPVA